MSTENQNELHEILRKLTYEDAQKLALFLGGLLKKSLEEIRPSKSKDFKNTLELAYEVNLLATHIAAEYGMRPSDVLLKALGLIKLALDAKSQGNWIAILNPNDEIVQEIVGFDSAEPAVQHAVQ